MNHLEITTNMMHLHYSELDKISDSIAYIKRLFKIFPQNKERLENELNNLTEKKNKLECLITKCEKILRGI